jgi:FAD/FMN-containing dehydrogenase
MKYIIELTADTKGLQPGVDALEQIGTVSKENAEQFKKTNEELKKVTSSVDQLSKGFKETGQAAVDVMRGIKLSMDPHWILNPGKVMSN